MTLGRQSAGPGCLLLLIAVAPLLLAYTLNPEGRPRNLTTRNIYLDYTTHRDASTQTSKSDLTLLDKTPPTVPSNVRVTTTPIPVVQAVQGYLNRTFLMTHTTDPFDSSGGDLIVVCASSHAWVTMTPSDSFGNTWISGAGPTTTRTLSALRTQVWYAKNPAVGPGHTFTLNLSTAQSLVISVLVVRGSDISSPIDAISTIADDHSSRTPRVTSSSIRTADGNDLLIGFAKSSASEAFVPDSGFTAQPVASSDFLAAESKLAGTPGSYNAAFTLSTAATWEAVVMAVKPSPLASSLSWTASTDNVGVAGYSVERCQGVRCRNFAQIATVTGTTFYDSALATATSYSYRVRAKDSEGNLSHYSEVLRVGLPAHRAWRMWATSYSRRAHPR
jgi:hypothetical protein